MTLGFNDEAAVAPFSRTVIRFSTNTISAPATAVINGKNYRFDHWSDSHPCLTHDVVPDLNTTRTAFYVLATAPPTTLPPCNPPPPAAPAGAEGLLDGRGKRGRHSVRRRDELRERADDVGAGPRVDADR